MRSVTVMQAITVLEKQFQTVNYEVLDDNTIRIFDYTDNPGIVNTSLMKAGITVLESTVSKNTLEDYFNEKMRGGVKNV